MHYGWQLPVAAQPWFVVTSGGGSWQVAEPSGMSNLVPLSVKHTRRPAQPLEPTFAWPERSSFSVRTSPGKVTSCSFPQLHDIDFRARLLSPHMRGGAMLGENFSQPSGCVAESIIQRANVCNKRILTVFLNVSEDLKIQSL